MTDTVQQSSTHNRSAGLLARRGLYEFTLVVVLFMVYFTTRGLVAGRAADAFHNAYQLMQLQRWLGISWELTVQSWIMQYDALVWLLNSIYVYTHMSGLILFAVWVFIWHHQRYREVRNVFLGLLVVGLLIYTLIPLAPPRFFSAAGFVDTLATTGSVDYQQEGISMLYNPYAAMPSLHVGFSVFVGIGVITIGRRWQHWIIGILFPLLMSIAVVGTGNHFVLDVVAGALLAWGAWYLVPRATTAIRNRVAKVYDDDSSRSAESRPDGAT